MLHFIRVNTVYKGQKDHQTKQYNIFGKYNPKPLDMYNGLIPKFIVSVKETKSLTMNIFRKKYFLFKSFVKNELSCVFTINMFSTAKSCVEQ